MAFPITEVCYESSPTNAPCKKFQSIFFVKGAKEQVRKGWGVKYTSTAESVSSSLIAFDDSLRREGGPTDTYIPRSNV